MGTKTGDRGRWVALLSILLALLLSLSGCMGAGDGDDDGDGDGDEDDGQDPGDGEDNGEDPEPEAPPLESTVRTSGNWPANPGFDPARLEATAGANLTLTFHNDDVAANHAWQLEGVEGARTTAISTGESADVTFIVPEPGEYTYFCPVGNHRDLGQEGVLVVT